MKNCIPFLFILFISTTRLQAQLAMPGHFAHYGVANGLAAYNTRCVVQDEKGFIWIGTINGLQRFDGSRFISFRHNPSYPNSIPDNNVEQILLDKFNNLWLVLNDGSIGIFDTRRFVFKKAILKLSNENNLQLLRKLYEDSEGNLIFTYFNTEAITYNRLTNIFSAANNPFPIPLNWKPVSTVQDPISKKYWIGTDSGMAVYHKPTNTLSYRGHNDGKEPLIDLWGKVAGTGSYKVDSKQRLWFLSWPVNAGASRLYCYDLKNNLPVLEQYDLAKVVNQYIEPDFFLEQKDGSIWISGLKFLAKYSEETKSFSALISQANEQSINFERINLFEDREHNLWAATNNNGVYVFNPAQQFFRSIKHYSRLYKQQGTGYLISFMPDIDGSILIGVWGEGLYRYDSSLNNIPLNIVGIPEANGFSVWDMCRTNDNRTVWLVGQQGFLFIYDQLTRQARRYDPPIFETKTIRQVVQDRQGTVWLGTQSRGVFKWTANKAVNKFEEGFEKVDFIPNVRVKKLLIDSKGYLWVCTNKEGVFKIDPLTGKIADHLSMKTTGKKLLSNDVADVFEYNDSIMIIATGALNIYHTKKNRVEYISSTDGLPADAVVSMEKDRAGFVWLGLLNGLCKMNLQKKTFAFYDRSDGIANDNFQLPASISLPDGRMLFGSSDDFVVFNPNESVKSSAPPDVIITDIKLMDKNLQPDSLMKLDKIEFRPDENSITIDFAALSYFSKSKILYFYKLEKIDKEWKKGNALNQAVYNYLPPGNYTFKVRSENADGVAGKNITEFKFTILPPFWKTWWFILLMILSAFVLLYWIDRFQVKRKEGLQRIRSEIAGNLHQEVNLALNNINILSEMARIKADTEPQKSKEYIEQIQSKSHNMIISMDDMLWSLSPENDSMRKTLERMREYIDALKNRHGVNYEILVEDKVEAMELDMKLRYEAFLLFKEAIKALIQIGATECKLHFGLEKSKLSFIMQLQNNCCDIHQLTALMGRQDMENRFKNINAELDVQVFKKHTVFTLLVPVV